MRINQETHDIAYWNNFHSGQCLMFDEYALTKAMLHVIRENVPGDVVELGCNIGESAKILQYTIQHEESDKRLYVYDSFQGLPAPNREKGDVWKEGTLKTTKEALIANFEKNDLPLPTIVEGWFKDITLLPEQVSFAFFDGDFYDSIKDSFNLVWDRVSVGGLVAVHDYFARGLRGVKLATDEFLEDKNHGIWHAYKNVDEGNDILIIRKF